MIKHYDIEIFTAEDFVLPFTLRDDNHQPIDLTGATVEASLAEYPGSSETIPFVAIHNDSGGHVTLSLPHEVTGQISYSAGYYDVFVNYPDETREQVLNGYVKIYPSVTRFPNDGTIFYMIALPDETYLPDSGNPTRLYYCTEPNIIYRWNGSAYVSVMRNYSVRVGTTTTLAPGSPATVTNSGTVADIVLDFGIPAGVPGDVLGPDSSTDDHVAVFDGATGKIIKDSGYTIGKSVPADAEFTDTTYTATTGSVGSASAGTAITADEIDSWDAGTLPSASVDDQEVLTLTFGSLPSLSYTEKSIPNISVTSATVVTGISAD